MPLVKNSYHILETASSFIGPQHPALTNDSTPRGSQHVAAATVLAMVFASQLNQVRAADASHINT